MPTRRPSPTLLYQSLSYDVTISHDIVENDYSVAQISYDIVRYRTISWQKYTKMHICVSYDIAYNLPRFGHAQLPSPWGYPGGFTHVSPGKFHEIHHAFFPKKIFFSNEKGSQANVVRLLHPPVLARHQMGYKVVKMGSKEDKRGQNGLKWLTKGHRRY